MANPTSAPDKAIRKSNSYAMIVCNLGMSHRNFLFLKYSEYFDVAKHLGNDYDENFVNTYCHG